MTVKLELTPDVQAGLLAQAQANGLSLEAYAELVLAGQRIRELRRGVTLGGVSIKDLIEEGRE
jgi:hypothetical protein